MEHATVCRDPECQKAPEKGGFCERHYQLNRNKLLGPCVATGCTRKSKARNLCNEHYLIELAGDKTCSVTGCPRYARTRGLCGTHYYRWNKSGDAGEAALRRKPPRDCKVEDCGNPAIGRNDLCRTHSDRLALYGNLLGRLCRCGVPVVRGTELCPAHHRVAVIAEIIAGKRKPVGRRNGYVVHKIRDEAVLEHRVIMEHLVGRPLEPFENVHHKNGRRDDNRPENLELWIKPQPSGQRPEDMADWMVAHYRDIVIAALAKTS